MKILMAFLLLTVCATQTNHMRIVENAPQQNIHYDSAFSANNNGEQQLYAVSSSEPKSRTKRGVFWDFFQKMIITKNLIVDVSALIY